MKRPVLYWAVLFILGEVVYKSYSVSMAGALLLAMAVVISVVMVIFRGKNSMIAWIGVLFFLTGFTCFYYQGAKLGVVEAFYGKRVAVSGTLLQRTNKENGVEYIMRTKTVAGHSMRTKLVFNSNEAFHTLHALRAGDRLTIEGKLTAYRQASNPGQFDEKSYRNGKGIFIKLTESSLKEKVSPSFCIRRGLEEVHEQWGRVYERLFDKEHASLACGMVLGDKAVVDGDIKKLYQKNGIAHLIAISGLHIAMIGGMLYQLLRKSLGSYGIAAGIGIGFIVSYGVLTGLSESTLRAVIMLVTQIGADVLGRKYDSVNAIALALIGMLFCNPYQIDQAGFLLSFAAVIGIAVVAPSWEKLFGELPSLCKSILLSVSVQLTIFPVMLYYFYEIPIYGVLLNLIVVPLMGVLLACLLLSGLVGFLCVSLAAYLAIPANCIFALYEALCKASEQLPFHTLCLGRPSLCWIVCYYGLLTFFVWLAYNKPKGRKLWLSLSGLGMLLLIISFYLPSNLEICMFDVGQGDGIYMRTPNHRHILIDGGSSSKQKVGAYILENGVKYYGAGCLDYVFVSHLDSDHYSGIKELLETRNVPIRNLVLPKLLEPDEAYRELEQLGRSAGCRLIYMERGDWVQIGDVRISCLNPTDRYYSDKNEGCLVLQVSSREFDMLFAGDMTKNVEQEILPYIEGSIEVLKVAHHGSDTSSGEAFIKALSPKVSLISVGANNSYGHPHKETLERLAATNTKVFRTDESGALMVRVKKGRVVVERF